MYVSVCFFKLKKQYAIRSTSPSSYGVLINSDHQYTLIRSGGNYV